MVVVAVVGLALGGNVQPISNGGSKQGAAAERTENEKPNASRGAASDQQVSAPDVARENESYAAEERQRGRDDLVAQQETAFWTRIMGMVAVFALLLSTIGIWLIYTTFRETRRAATSAQNTYRAFTELERARIIAEPSGVLSNPPHIIGVRIGLTNIGKSTAAILSAHCGYMEGCEFPAEFEQEIGIDRAVPSADETKFVIHASNLKVFETHPFVGGYVEYRSAFGQTHRAYFLARIDFVPGAAEGLTGRQDYSSVRSDALYCSREEREANFGWPADS